MFLIYVVIHICNEFSNEQIFRVFIQYEQKEMLSLTPKFRSEIFKTKLSMSLRERAWLLAAS